MNYTSLIDRFGSPMYVYNLDSIKYSYKKLMACLPRNSILYYSLKANPHPSVVKQLVNLGCRCEVSSTNELNISIHAGANADQILFTGPAKTFNEIEWAAKCGVKLFSCESWYELEKLKAVAEQNNIKLNVILRINPDIKSMRSGLAMTGVSSQFGIDEEKILSAPTHLIKCPSIDIIGFHIFNGTNSRDVDGVVESFIYSIHMAKRLASILEIDLQFLDLGGGFGYPFAKLGNQADFSMVEKAVGTLFEKEILNWGNRSTEIAFESGRFLVGGCGQYICTVTDVKESKGNTYTLLDGGINHLGGMSGLGRIQKLDVDCIIVDEKSKDGHFVTSLVGPLCTPLDVMNRPSEMKKIMPGDILVIPNVGAYGLTASLLGFLSREAPVEVIIENNEVLEASQIVLNREPIFSIH